MTARKIITAAAVLFFSMNLSAAQAKKIAVLPLNTLSSQQFLLQLGERYLHEISSLLARDGGYTAVSQRTLKSTAAIIRQQNWDLSKKRGMSALGNLVKADIVVSGELLYNAAENKIIVNISILETTRQTFIEQFVLNDTPNMYNMILGNMVNKVYASLNRHFNRTGSGFTETTTPITTSDPVTSSASSSSSAGTASSSSSTPQTPVKQDQWRTLTFNTVFNYKMILPVFNQELEKILGIDFIFDLERSFYAFGFGLELQGSSLVNILPFFELHFFENNYHRHWQGYLRLSTGLNYPLNSSAEMDISLRTTVGVRFTASYFNFDIGAGLNYFRSQTSSILLGIGGGFHF